MKYVILSVTTRAKPEPVLHALLFTEGLSHREVYLGARSGLWLENDSSCEVEVHGAGFFRWQSSAVVTHGHSETLNTGPNPDGKDALLINAALRGQPLAPWPWR